MANLKFNTRPGAYNKNKDLSAHPIARRADQVVQVDLQNMFGMDRVNVRMSGKVMFAEGVGGDGKSVSAMVVVDPRKGRGKNAADISIACTRDAASKFLAAKIPATLPPVAIAAAQQVIGQGAILGNDVDPAAAAQVLMPILLKVFAGAQKIVRSALKTGHEKGSFVVGDLVPAEIIVKLRAGAGAAAANYSNILKVGARAFRINVHVLQ